MLGALHWEPGRENLVVVLSVRRLRRPFRSQRLRCLAQLARLQPPEDFRLVKSSMADFHWMFLNAPSLSDG